MLTSKFSIPGLARDPAPRRRPSASSLVLLALFTLSLMSAGSAGAVAVLDWAAVTWADGDLENTYLMSNGVSVTIKVSTAAAGSFNLVDAGGGLVVTAPFVDGPLPSGSADFFGTVLDLGIFFNPDTGQGLSPVLIEVTFSEPVTELSFAISDIDYSQAGVIAGKPEDSRLDEVVLTSDAGDPTLVAVDGDPSFVIAGNKATAIPLRTVDGSDEGTVVASFPDGVTSATITYNEVSGNADPAGRGIGILAQFTQVPVELMTFSVD